MTHHRGAGGGMAKPNGYPFDANWRLMLADLDVQPARVFRRAQMSEDLLSRDSPQLTRQQWFAFWTAIEEETGAQVFPLHVVERVTTEVMSPPLFAAMCSPNLEIASQRLGTYKRLVCPMALDVVSDAETLTLTFRWLDEAEAPPASLMAFEIAFVTRLARISTRHHVCPIRATTPEPPSETAAYKDFLGVPVDKAPQTSVSFARVDADRPFLTANAAMWDAFEPQLRQRLADIDQGVSMAEGVKMVLLEALPSGQTAMESVGKRLGVSKRTLQRRLRDEETTFMAVLNQTREKLALHDLQHTPYTCTEIAFLLGFEEPSSFFRAFHDWTGTTPESLRRDERALAPPVT